MSLLLEHISHFDLQEVISMLPDTCYIVFDFFEGIIDSIKGILNFTFERLPYNALNRLIVYLILIFFFSLLILLPSILISKLYIAYRKSKYNELYKKYSQYVIGFLIGNQSKEDIKELKGIESKTFHRNVMIHVLMSIDKAENKEVSDKIRMLYTELKLDRDSVKKLNRRAWNKKIFGIRELSHMRVKSENRRIMGFQQKSNEVLRIESQMGLIKLLPFVPFAFLDSQEKPFTVWEQINVFDLIRKNRIEIPEFHLWLDHWNDSVVMFCLDMIRVLKQKEAAAKVMELIDHDNDLVKGKVIKTLIDLENRDAVSKLKEIFVLEELPNQLNIIRSIGKLGMESEINFLLDKLNDEEFKIQMEACKSIAMIGEFGVNKLKEKLEDADEQLKSIINHVLDPRI